MSKKFKTYEEELRSLEIGLKMAADTIEKLKDDSWYDSLKEEHSAIEKERQDLLHYAELVNFNASEGYRIAKELKENAIKRRAITDLIDLVIAIRSVAKDSKCPTDKFLKFSSKAISESREKRQKRGYALRVRRDLKPIMESKGVKVY